LADADASLILAIKTWYMGMLTLLNVPLGAKKLLNLWILLPIRHFPLLAPNKESKRREIKLQRIKADSLLLEAVNNG